LEKGQACWEAGRGLSLYLHANSFEYRDVLQGVPFDPDDAMFNPPSPRRSTATALPPSYQPPVQLQVLQAAPLPTTQPQAPPQPPPPPQALPPQPQTQAPQQPNWSKRETPSHGQLQRVIPPEEDMRRLFQECRFADGNAQLLSEALTFASPEDLRDKEIIKVRVGISLVRSERADSVPRNGIQSASPLKI
jgi:hypothetical protein